MSPVRHKARVGKVGGEEEEAAPLRGSLCQSCAWMVPVVLTDGWVALIIHRAEVQGEAPDNDQ